MLCQLEKKDFEKSERFVVVNDLPCLIKNFCKKSFKRCGYFIESFLDFSKNTYKKDIYSSTRGIPFRNLDAEFQAIMKEEFS